VPLVIHFLNVGRGDCTVIEFPSGNLTMVDIDNLRSFDPTTRSEVLEEIRKAAGVLAPIVEKRRLAEQEAKLADPFQFLDDRFGKDAHIFRLIITHPDMDHMTGITRLVDERVIGNFWHSGSHDFNLETWKADEGPYDIADWETYKQLRKSKTNPRALVNRAKDTGEYWTDDGIKLWAPTDELVDLAVEREMANIVSMVLRVKYKGRAIVLGGDATADESWPAIMETINVRHVSVLKASHHGRKTGYHRAAVKAMSPWLTVTSVAQAEYDATESYRRYSTHTVSLRDSGDIQITISDDGVLHYPSDIEKVWKDKTT